MENAVFVSETKAILLGERVLDTSQDAEDYQVRPYRKRGEMKGYTVSIRYKTGWQALSENDVARIEVEGGL